MQIRRLGYACINHELNTRKPKVTTSRTMRKATFKKKGLEYVSELAKRNLTDLWTILRWNASNGVFLYRMSSELFPWKSEWEWEDLPDWDIVRRLLETVGDHAKRTGQRLTFHPGPYNKLCSEESRIVNNTITDLEIHAQIMDFMGLSQSYENTINIHLGAAYGDKRRSANTWVKNYKKLSKSLKSRLTIENDDKVSLFNTQELIDSVHQDLGIPVMFDFHHHRLYPVPGEDEQETVNKAIATWPDNITPIFHWSESRAKEHGDDSIKLAAHSDLCYGPIPQYKTTRPIDLMIEAKHKEKSIPLIKYGNGQTVQSKPV